MALQPEPNKLRVIQMSKPCCSGDRPVAHSKNLEKQVNKVRFESFGAQQIPYESESFDVVIMLKSSPCSGNDDATI